ncbi:hypothetical protein [Alteromonas oceanisediminis]|uniref:hypothetical protein n=1 Tax=Alteromonas oceanisediminis TaxID=2836180 RepID=UPI001BD99650|nr:hypothetical protein [Alteromonas oceanisediminis]MBT0586902.1 hypothetical protein [Alteromonas oceanisediminis]
MNRRQFLKNTTYGLSTLAFASSWSASATVTDHPDVIHVIPNGNQLSQALQLAFEQAFQLWQNDSLSRRPVIQLPSGQFTIDEIPGNNRGDYPFHLPPTFKLVGEGASSTRITCSQARTQQYRFLMVRPETRLDDAALTPSFDISISDITFERFDNAISLQDATHCAIHDCRFENSLVAVQLDLNSRFGNQGHSIQRCVFDAKDSSGVQQKFCLRFEAPFSNVLTRIESGITSAQQCLALGGDANDYSASAQTCVVPDDTLIADYLDTLFGTQDTADIANQQCTVSHCDFYHSAYSAIEFAGKLNRHNQVTYCGFYHCEGTAVEFDKGASHNTVDHCVISGMKPTITFAPAMPYVFQAAVQEQEGSRSVDARLKHIIQTQGYADPNSPNFKGLNIFERAVALPDGNTISDNQFDVSRSYWLADYEPDTTKHNKLPDVYPSIKLSACRDTQVFRNSEFLSDPSAQVTQTNVMGQSVVMYQNDMLRDERGGVRIENNQFYGAWFYIGDKTSPKDTRPLLVKNNSFGHDDGYPRGGISANYCYANTADISDNTVVCAYNASAAIFRQFDINSLSMKGNHLTVPASNSIYIRSQESSTARSNVTYFENNTIDGGHALYIYDYSAARNPANVHDQLHFNGNTIKNMSGSGRVIAVTLWAKNIVANSNRYEHIEDKVFQQYSLSDSFSHDGNNTLMLSPSSQNRVYSRDYDNTRGSYITADYW